jgi:hypothetical protein
MALDATKVRVAVTGAVYADPTNAAAAPTSTGSAVDPAFNDLGYVSEDGVTLTFPDAGDKTSLKAWQNGATVRVVRATTDDSPTIALTLIETKLEVIETVFGVTVTSTATDGSFEYDVNDSRTNLKLLVDVIDGSELIRAYAPSAIVTSIGDLSLTHTDLIGYEVTFDCERDATAGFNLKTWMTALKS